MAAWADTSAGKFLGRTPTNGYREGAANALRSRMDNRAWISAIRTHIESR
jgi:hypothetical protein